MSINPNDISGNLNPIIDEALINVHKSEPPPRLSRGIQYRK